MQYRLADEPEQVDRDVRFRTSYYFRVFDLCLPPEPARLSNAMALDQILSPNGSGYMLSDSLYRFTMTGKARALTTKVRFESGILRADQIDPFGTSVGYDQRTGQFHVQSHAETQEERRVNRAFGDVERLIELRNRLDQLGPSAESARDHADEAIADIVGTMVPKRQSTAPSTPELPGRSSGWSESKAPENLRLAADALCPEPSAEETSKNCAIAFRLRSVNDAVAALDKGSSQLSLTGRELIKPLQDELKEHQTALQEGTDSLDAEIETYRRDAETSRIQAEEALASITEISAGLEEIQTKLEQKQTEKSFTSQLVNSLGKLIESERAQAEEGSETTGEVTEKIQEYQSQFDSLNERKESVRQEIHRLQEDKHAKEEALATATRTEEESREDQRRFLTEADKRLQVRKQLSATADQISQAQTHLQRVPAPVQDPRPTDVCGAGLVRRRGFQVMGPEGWRQFNPDERLLMAMFSSDRPLTDVLTRTATRIQDARHDPTGRALSFSQERLRALETLQALNAMSLPEPAKAIDVVDRALDRLGAKAIRENGTNAEPTPES